MFRKAALSILSLVLVAGFLPAAQAATATAEEARVVVYRAEESSRTKRMKMQITLGAESVGRLKYNRAVVTTAAPGEYRLSTSLEGTLPLVIDVQPGQTYYVHTRLRKLGNTVTPELVLVEEQVAMEHQPAMGQAI